MLGDIVHNLRSSLDALVYLLASKHLGRAPDGDEAKRIQFPIADTVHTWRSESKRWLSLADPLVMSAIEQLQPFHGTDPNQIHMLAAVRDLSNIDKHRHLIFALATSQSSKLTIRVAGHDKGWTAMVMSGRCMRARLSLDGASRRCRKVLRR